MSCLNCGQGLHKACGVPCCGQTSICPQRESRVDDLVKDVVVEPKRIGRPPKADDEVMDPYSTGRRRAQALYPIDPEEDCEWKGKAEVGGGLYPVVGCLTGKQKETHHGPVKDTMVNERENVHLICGRCVTPEMRILRANLEWVPAGNIQIGDRLIGFEEELKNSKYQVAEVLDVQFTVKTVFKFVMSDGSVLRSSYDHQWVGVRANSHPQNKWRQTNSFKVGQAIRKPLKVWEQEDNYEAGWLGGFLDGEGSLTGKLLTMSQKSIDPLNPYLEYVLGTFDLTHVNIQIREAKDNRQQQTVWRISRVPEVLNLLGVSQPKRLIPKIPGFITGREMQGKLPTIIEIVCEGEQEVVSIETSTRTFMCEGFASHNCHKLWHTWNDGPYNEEIYAREELRHNPREGTREELRLWSTSKSRPKPPILRKGSFARSESTTKTQL